MAKAKRPTTRRTAPRPALSVRDHTTIVKAGIDNAERLRRLLPTTRKPSGPAVLGALLNVDSVSARTKDRIRIVLAVVDALERQRVRLPAKAAKAVREVSDQVDAAKSVTEMTRALKRAQADKRYADVEGMDQGLAIALGILEDGASSIYSGAYYMRMLGKKGSGTIDQAVVFSTAGGIAKEDVKGGVSGAVVGCVAGASGGTIALPGAGSASGCVAVGGLGALGGAAAGSIGEAVGALWDWIF